MNEIFIGNKIAMGRKEMGLSQAQFANMLSVSQQAVAKWELGESMPDVVMLMKIAEILGKDLNYFSNDNGSMFGKREDGANKEYEKETGRANNQGPSVPRDMGFAQWKDADFSGIKNIKGMSFTNVDKCKFADADLRDVSYKFNTIKNSDFKEADFKNSSFAATNIWSNDFEKANFYDCSFNTSNLYNNNFTGTNFKKAVFKVCIFDENKMSGAVLSETEFNKCIIKKLNFSGTITNCSFMDCSYNNSGFKDAIMRNVFFKGRNLHKLILDNCQVDKLTYEFLRNAKANLTNVTVID